MWTAFPSSDYYGDSAPSHVHQPTTGLPFTALDGRCQGRSRDGSHVHHVSGRWGWCPAIPDAASPQVRRRLFSWPPDWLHQPASESSTFAQVDVHCFPAQIRQVRAGSTLVGVPPLVHSSCTFPSCLPNPSRLAIPVRLGVVRAAPTFPCVSRVRLPSASPVCCDRSAVGLCIPPGYAAPHGAR